MSKSTELSFARLVDWLENRLTEAEAASIAAQVVAADEETRAMIAWLQAFTEISATTVLASPPAQVHELLVQHFVDYTQNHPRPDFLQRLIAALTFDSQAQPLAAGLRAAGTQAAVRQLIYTSDLADVALNIQPRPYDQRLDVNGQIFLSSSASPEVFSVQLLRGAVEIGLTTSDELGEFSFEAVPTGVYELILSAAEIEILIKPIELSM
ncbi:MAG: hypothetical protein Fur0044_22740 [Anaerolineae bacterium]|nr:hypothetical protein [Anaerolineales bacterium]MCQ3975658.1 hypothetical protein [Anaerolineae bacterium]